MANIRVICGQTPDSAILESAFRGQKKLPKKQF
jgi:hypothetical protein